MKGDLLNWLMIISVHAPKDRTKFNYEAVVVYWAARWKHRVQLLPAPAEETATPLATGTNDIFASD
jgi:hypothetical protein